MYINLFFTTLPWLHVRGGDLRGLEGRPPKIWGGDGPCIGPPIFWEVVLWDERERSNRVKNRCREGILYLNSAFPCEERSCTTFYTIKTQKVKIRKTWLMTKKKVIHQNFLTWKWKFPPPKKRHSEILVRENFFRAPKLGARSPPLHHVMAQRAIQKCNRKLTEMADCA